MTYFISLPGRSRGSCCYFTFSPDRSCRTCVAHNLSCEAAFRRPVNLSCCRNKPRLNIRSFSHKYTVSRDVCKCPVGHEKFDYQTYVKSYRRKLSPTRLTSMVVDVSFSRPFSGRCSSLPCRCALQQSCGRQRWSQYNHAAVVRWLRPT